MTQKVMDVLLADFAGLTDLLNDYWTHITSRAGGRHNMPPPPVTLTINLLTLKLVSESNIGSYDLHISRVNKTSN